MLNACLNVKIVFSYDGSMFNGWHGDNTNSRCVYLQKSIQNALFVLFKQNINIVCAGRTDSGVHGVGQVCSFTIPFFIELYRVRKVIEYFAKISIRNIEYVNEKFHARFSAKKRQYMYLIGTSYSPLLKKRIFVSRYELNVNKMQEACDFIIKQKELRFFAPKSYTGNTCKTIDKFYIQKQNLFGFDVIAIHVASRSFFHHQIRNMVGCLYEIGRGEWSMDEFIERFYTQDRSNCAAMIDACGLYFMSVEY